MVSERSNAVVSLFLWAVVLGTACACAKSAVRPLSSANLRLKVLRSFPHDTRAYTQGLLMFGGKLYESTGLLGRSTVRRVDLASGVVERETSLPPDLFGEGLARVGQRLFQLTWKNHRALVWDLATLEKVAEFSYQGEGWGLCFDGKRLVMSDGSDRLTFRNPTSFRKEGEVQVRRGGKPVANLNELECVRGLVYANVWGDSHIARIDPMTGEATGWIDASGLLGPSEAASADVLNGIAELEGTDHLLVTGKLWPRIFEVQVVPAGKDEAK